MVSQLGKEPKSPSPSRQRQVSKTSLRQEHRKRSGTFDSTPRKFKQARTVVQVPESREADSMSEDSMLDNINVAPAGGCPTPAERSASPLSGSGQDSPEMPTDLQRTQFSVQPMPAVDDHPDIPNPCESAVSSSRTVLEATPEIIPSRQDDMSMSPFSDPMCPDFDFGLGTQIPDLDITQQAQVSKPNEDVSFDFPDYFDPRFSAQDFGHFRPTFRQLYTLPRHIQFFPFLSDGRHAQLPSRHLDPNSNESLVHHLHTTLPPREAICQHLRCQWPVCLFYEGMLLGVSPYAVG